MKADVLLEVAVVFSLVVLASSLAYFTCVEHPRFLGDGKAKGLSLWCACLSMLTALVEFTRLFTTGGIIPMLCGLMWMATAAIWMWIHHSENGSDVDGGAR